MSSSRTMKAVTRSSRFSESRSSRSASLSVSLRLRFAPRKSANRPGSSTFRATTLSSSDRYPVASTSFWKSSSAFRRSASPRRETCFSPVTTSTRPLRKGLCWISSTSLIRATPWTRRRIPPSGKRSILWMMAAVPVPDSSETEATGRARAPTSELSPSWFRLPAAPSLPGSFGESASGPPSSSPASTVNNPIILLPARASSIGSRSSRSLTTRGNIMYGKATTSLRGTRGRTVGISSD